MKKVLFPMGAAALLALPFFGCATKDYVKGEVQTVNGRVDTVEGQVEDAQTQLKAHDSRISKNEQATQQASKTAQDALDRALAAGKLAEGKLLYETVLSDDKVKFGFDKTEIADDAKKALDEFAEGLKAQNKNVYIEVQGHTDSIGSDDYNLKLGEKRAEAVRRYLNQKAGIPLHRINVISYGESAPVADNSTRDGRAKNRRVVLVVLQ